MIEREWAWAQVEAMADGSLEGDDLRRMQRVLSDDARLRAAVAAANAVLRGLRHSPIQSPPAGLLRRLLAQGSASRTRSALHMRRRRSGRQPFQRGWYAAPLGVAATALIALLFGSMLERMPSQAEQDAMRDFAVAMSYLRQTAETTSDQVEQQLGQGVMSAFVKSRETLAGDEQADEQNGG